MRFAPFGVVERHAVIRRLDPHRHRRPPAAASCAPTRRPGPRHPNPASRSTRVLSALPPTVWPRSIWIRRSARQRQRHPGDAGIVRFLELDLRDDLERARRRPRVQRRERRSAPPPWLPGIPAGSSQHPNAVMARIARDARHGGLIVDSRGMCRRRCTACSPQPAPANATPARAGADRDTRRRPISRSASREQRADTAPCGDLDAIVGARLPPRPGRAEPHAFRDRRRPPSRPRRRCRRRACAAHQRARRQARVTAVFIETREDQLIPDLLAGKGDVAANLLLTFERDEQVAFAPPIVTGIRELVVTGPSSAAGQPRGCRRPHHPRPQEQRSPRQPAPAQRAAEEDQPPAGADRRRRRDADRRGPARAGERRHAFRRRSSTTTSSSCGGRLAAGSRPIAISRSARTAALSWVTRKDAPKLRRGS